MGPAPDTVDFAVCGPCAACRWQACFTVAGCIRDADRDHARLVEAAFEGEDVQQQGFELRASTMTGIVMMCVGVASLCVNDALAKTLTEGYSPLQIQFMRNLIALPFALLIAFKMGGTPALRSHRPLAHLLRGTL
jgi:hypothetical protein